ncbi:MAG: hypothetical protein VX170_03880 [Pseudomonadota bacterium]|nr:hypothetical protein [Pseudomonadota bacterium]
MVDFTAALLVATGVTAALWALPGAAPVIQAVGLAYLLYLAYRIATAPVGAAAGTRAAGWLPAFALAIANPKVYAAIGAVFAGHTLIAGQATPDAIAKLTVLAVLMRLVYAALSGSVRPWPNKCATHSVAAASTWH